ncbi:MAG: DUF4976 domain-containing protein, partial [Rhodoferax sp.]|nr:DUF4976 domain-containing protein [Rhodoferax sp.]
VRTLVTATHRMSVFVEGGWGELYDLQADPHEMDNLWERPEHAPLKLQLMQELAQQMMAMSDASPRPTRIA